MVRYQSTWPNPVRDSGVMSSFFLFAGSILIIKDQLATQCQAQSVSLSELIRSERHFSNLPKFLPLKFYFLLYSSLFL